MDDSEIFGGPLDVSEQERRKMRIKALKNSLRDADALVTELANEIDERQRRAIDLDHESRMKESLALAHGRTAKRQWTFSS
ncbi:MAG: hypothetical protein U5K30_14110 [Acidimicrobiales bacterium]|nr:hypothetical protein [Acidimicrobiales bacterium]